MPWRRSSIPRGFAPHSRLFTPVTLPYWQVISVWVTEKLFRHPTAMRRGVGGFRVAKHLHLPVTHDKQAETAGRERYDALVGERTERFWDGLIRRRVVLLATAVELYVAVDRDDASDAT